MPPGSPRPVIQISAVGERPFSVSGAVSEMRTVSPFALASSLIISWWRPVPASMFSAPTSWSRSPGRKSGWSRSPLFACDET
jgi:hypothetical protein